MNLFGAASKKLDPIEQAKEWKRKIQHESRSLDRDIAKIKQAEQKALIECKKLAKQGQVNAAKILAREVANARAQQERLHLAKTQLNSVSMQLQTSVATMKMGACMKSSAEIMGTMNRYIMLLLLYHVFMILTKCLFFLMTDYV